MKHVIDSGKTKEDKAIERGDMSEIETAIDNATTVDDLKTIMRRWLVVKK